MCAESADPLCSSLRSSECPQSASAWLCPRKSSRELSVRATLRQLAFHRRHRPEGSVFIRDLLLRWHFGCLPNRMSASAPPGYRERHWLQERHVRSGAERCVRPDPHEGPSAPHPPPTCHRLAICPPVACSRTLWPVSACLPLSLCAAAALVLLQAGAVSGRGALGSFPKKDLATPTQSASRSRRRADSDRNNGRFTPNGGDIENPQPSALSGPRRLVMRSHAGFSSASSLRTAKSGPIRGNRSAVTFLDDIGQGGFSRPSPSLGLLPVNGSSAFPRATSAPVNQHPFAAAVAASRGAAAPAALHPTSTSVQGSGAGLLPADAATSSELLADALVAETMQRSAAAERQRAAADGGSSFRGVRSGGRSMMSGRSVASLPRAADASPTPHSGSDLGSEASSGWGDIGGDGGEEDERAGGEGSSVLPESGLAEQRDAVGPSLTASVMSTHDRHWQALMGNMGNAAALPPPAWGKLSGAPGENSGIGSSGRLSEGGGMRITPKNISVLSDVSSTGGDGVGGRRRRASLASLIMAEQYDNPTELGDFARSRLLVIKAIRSAAGLSQMGDSGVSGSAQWQSGAAGLEFSGFGEFEDSGPTTRRSSGPPSFSAELPSPKVVTGAGPRSADPAPFFPPTAPRPAVLSRSGSASSQAQAGDAVPLKPALRTSSARSGAAWGGNFSQPQADAPPLRTAPSAVSFGSLPSPSDSEAQRPARQLQSAMSGVSVSSAASSTVSFTRMSHLINEARAADGSYRSDGSSGASFPGPSRNGSQRSGVSGVSGVARSSGKRGATDRPAFIGESRRSGILRSFRGGGGSGNVASGSAAGSGVSRRADIYRFARKPSSSRASYLPSRGSLVASLSSARGSLPTRAAGTTDADGAPIEDSSVAAESALVFAVLHSARLIPAAELASRQRATAQLLLEASDEGAKFDSTVRLLRAVLRSVSAVPSGGAWFRRRATANARPCQSFSQPASMSDGPVECRWLAADRLLASSLDPAAGAPFGDSFSCSTPTALGMPPLA